MPQLLVELFSEEIPARMQRRAAEDFQRLTEDRLKAAGLAYEAARSYVTPRRLALVVEGLPAAQPDVSEERKGPRVGSPDAAVQGFLRGAGVASLDQCEERDTGKGVFYFAIIKKSGRPTAEVLPDLLREVVTGFPWPKSMRFPAAGFRWVRPLTSAICLFDGKVVPIPLDGIPVGDTTQGHRFLAPGAITVKDFADYQAKLSQASVLLDPEDRRKTIASGLAAAAAKVQVTVKPDQGLLDEVMGLVEFPVVLTGSIDQDFMDLPSEVLTTSMRAHQKYFACLDGKGALAPYFLVVANVRTDDGGKAIVAGNERVLRARLSDARFFWDQDRKAKLESRVPKLVERIFHASLGTLEDKISRMQGLVKAIAPAIPGCDAAEAQRAALLCKADLSSGMVGEFPDLQGVMGRYYARADGESAAVAEAIREHYSPLGPQDACPSAPVSVAVALADKIDTLAGFFGIGETPTGSKDPFARRRAALGVIRIILENKLRLPLLSIFEQAAGLSGAHIKVKAGAPRDTARLLLDFFAERLKVHLKEQGVRHDLIAAIFALGDEDDLVRLLARVSALDGFLKSDDGANLLVAYRRASNIVRIEERKDGKAHDGAPDAARFVEPAESALAERLADVQKLSGNSLGQEAFNDAMGSLATLREPVDEFFTRVTVNSEDEGLRANRLRLLWGIRNTLNKIADFSQIEG